MAGTGDRPEDSPMEPDDINSRLAEIAAELASEARFKEPSAAERARARAAAAKKAPAPARGGRVHRWHVRKSRASRTTAKLREPGRAPGAPEPARPRSTRRPRRAQRAAWKAGRPAADRGYSDSGHPSTRQSVLTVIVIVVLLIGASIGLRTLLHRGTPAAPAAPASPGRASSTPTQTPPATTQTASAADLFAGVPANYANDAAGIVVPPARPAGSFTASQVSKAFAAVRQLVFSEPMKASVVTLRRRRWLPAPAVPPARTGQGHAVGRSAESLQPGLADGRIRLVRRQQRHLTGLTRWQPDGPL